MTRIKICGMKEEAHARAAAQAGVDFIGLVFAPSPRRVSIDRAEEIASAVKKDGRSTRVVGVFVNVPVYVVNRIADVCHLDWVQLSGDESWEYCAGVARPVIKVVRLSARQHPEEVCADLAEGVKLLKQEYICLFDSPVKDRYGGTGIAFDWGLARQAARQFPVIIAGGLDAQNVAGAIKTAAPWGVDVSSGVETDGVKDLAKIKSFIEAVRRADDTSS